MKDSILLQRLSPEQRRIWESIHRQSCDLLDHSHRFRFFTLHGRSHIASLVRITDLLIDGGVDLTQDESFLFACAICMHDLGMVIPLQAWDVSKILDGKPTSEDPAALEGFIRDRHHSLLELYFREHASFLGDLGLNPTQQFHINEISKCHRKVDLNKQSGFLKSLGALLRLIDELDLSATRAPIASFRSMSSDMDATSIWHWFKHNITEEWDVNRNVFRRTVNGKRSIEFRLIVHPSKADSIPYWLHQIRRPITKALYDDSCARIIEDRFGLSINLEQGHAESSPHVSDETWSKLEDLALSAGRKVILVVDDEQRKLIDLFTPLMDDFHVVFSPNAKDALQRIAARLPDLVIVDMQLGSGFIWNEKDTADFKNTGAVLIGEIRKQYPSLKLGILTGTMHNTSAVKKEALSFFLRKPIEPDVLKRKVTNVLK